MRKSNKILTAIMSIFIVLLLFCGAAFAFAFIGNGQKNFYVRYGNEILMSETKDIVFEKDVYTVLNCGTLTGQTVAYDVAVTFNVEDFETFVFFVGSAPVDFNRNFIDFDCSTLFYLEKSDDYFMLYISENITVEQIIKLKYPNEVLTEIPEIEFWGRDNFIITVKDTVEQSLTRIAFH